MRNPIQETQSEFSLSEYGRLNWFCTNPKCKHEYKTSEYRKLNATPLGRTFCIYCDWQVVYGNVKRYFANRAKVYAKRKF